MKYVKVIFSHNRAFLIGITLLFIGVVGSSTYLAYTLVSTRSFIRVGSSDVVSFVDLQNLLLSVRTAEDSQRGYALSGETSYLAPYNMAIKEVPEEMAALNANTNLNPWRNQVNQLESLVNNRMSKLSEGITLRNTSGLPAFATAIQDNNGEVLMNQVQSSVTQLETAELSKIGPEDKQATTNIHRSLLITPILVILVAGICVIIVMYFRRVIQRERTVEGVKNEFLSLASHQLRTPATNVKQYLGLLIEGYFGELDEQQIAAIKIANKNNEIEINIMNELLNITKLDLNKISLQLAPTDVGSIIQNVVDDYSAKIVSRNQILSFKAPKRTPIIAKADKVYYRTVVDNLVDNASKYSPTGGKIKITLTNSPEGVVLSVKDNGIGIKKADIPKLFKKFSRVQNELSNSIDGSGLGLYWVNRIIELHGGYITVNSTPGKGTEFIVTIPRSNGKPKKD